MASAATWSKAQADYRAGLTLVKICSKHKVTMRDLLKRMKDDGWTRRGEEKLPVPSAAAEHVNAKVDAALDEAMADIVNSHKRISKRLRDEFDEEMAEFQELKLYFASILDKNTVDHLIKQVEPGMPNPALQKYLIDCLLAFTRRMNISDKLVRLASLIVDTERRVWGIDRGGEGSEFESYDDLLDVCKTPLPVRSLPPNVTDFEQKLREKQSV